MRLFLVDFFDVRKALYCINATKAIDNIPSINIINSSQIHVEIKPGLLHKQPFYADWTTTSKTINRA